MWKWIQKERYVMSYRLFNWFPGPITEFLAYFPKLKLGLSNHQLDCLCVPLIIFYRLVDFHEIWFGGHATQGDLDAIIFNSIASIILK
jgi:hypothetical protein